MNRPAITRRKQRGQAMLEFTFVGIPLMFVLISIFEMSRGMWMYHTMAFSVKDGVRFAVVHGINCINTTGTGGTNPNTCKKTIADIAAQIQGSAVIFDPTKTTLTFFPGDGGAASTPCTMVGAGAGGCPQFKTNAWPPFDSTGATSLDAVGKPIRIDITAPFQSALSMFWPGSRPVNFGTYTLGASSTDYVQY
jgi:Flp pilus assembly protein TadG